MGRNRDITPVEATPTSVSRIPNVWAVRKTICFESYIPCTPVMALALPLFITRACSILGSLFIMTSIGAARTLFWV